MKYYFGYNVHYSGDRCTKISDFTTIQFIRVTKKTTCTPKAIETKKRYMCIHDILVHFHTVDKDIPETG